MLKYKMLAEAFSYPKEEGLQLEYDRLFRQGEVWLYGLEYAIENEFQRAQGLADINGFYRAFGLETDKERPDSLVCELEFKVTKTTATYGGQDLAGKKDRQFLMP